MSFILMMSFIFLINAQTESHHEGSVVTMSMETLLYNVTHCAGHSNRIHSLPIATLQIATD